MAPPKGNPQSGDRKKKLTSNPQTPSSQTPGSSAAANEGQGPPEQGPQRELEDTLAQRLRRFQNSSYQPPVANTEAEEAENSKTIAVADVKTAETSKAEVKKDSEDGLEVNMEELVLASTSGEERSSETTIVCRGPSPAPEGGLEPEAPKALRRQQKMRTSTNPATPERAEVTPDPHNSITNETQQPRAAAAPNVATRVPSPYHMRAIPEPAPTPRTVPTIEITQPQATPVPEPNITARVSRPYQMNPINSRLEVDRTPLEAPQPTTTRSSTIITITSPIATPEVPQQCTICYESFTTRCQLLPCSHSFDRTCILPWLQSLLDENPDLNVLTCPLCRQIINCISHSYQPNGTHTTEDIERIFRGYRRGNWWEDPRRPAGIFIGDYYVNFGGGTVNVQVGGGDPWAGGFQRDIAVDPGFNAADYLSDEEFQEMYERGGITQVERPLARNERDGAQMERRDREMAARLQERHSALLAEHGRNAIRMRNRPHGRQSWEDVLRQNALRDSLRSIEDAYESLLRQRANYYNRRYDHPFAVNGGATGAGSTGGQSGRRPSAGTDNRSTHRLVIRQERNDEVLEERYVNGRLMSSSRTGVAGGTQEGNRPVGNRIQGDDASRRQRLNLPLRLQGQGSRQPPPGTRRDGTGTRN